MRKEFIVGFMDDMQQQNSRLKNDLIGLRKKMHIYESTMMQQLEHLSKNSFDSPQKYLEAFVSQLKTARAQQNSKDQMIFNLSKQIKKLEQEKTHAQQQLQIKISEISSMQRSLDQKRLSVILQLNTTRQQKQKLREMLGELQVKTKDQRDQFSSVLKQKDRIIQNLSKKHKQQMKLQTQLEDVFTKTKAKNQQLQIKIKDLGTSLNKINANQMLNNKDVQSMRMLVQEIVQMDQLNQHISRLQAQNHQLKRDISDSLNKKVSTDITNQDLRTNLNITRNKLTKREEQLQKQSKQLQQITTELSELKVINQDLERYYDNKWTHQFQRVKINLEKVYIEKVQEYQLQIKKRTHQVDTRINAYVIMHQEDLRIAQGLHKNIRQLQAQRKQQYLKITEKQQTIIELKRIIQETNLMIFQHESGLLRQYDLRMSERNITIRKLQQLILQISVNGLQFEQKVDQKISQIRLQFDQQRQNLKEEHKIAIENMQKNHQKALQKLKQEHEEKIQKKQAYEHHLRQQMEMQQTQVVNRLTNRIQQGIQQLEEKRKQWKEDKKYLQQKQKVLLKQLQQVKFNSDIKIQNLQYQVQIKKKAMKMDVQKISKEESLKQQLKNILQEQTQENKELNKKNKQLIIQIQAKHCQVLSLKDQLQTLTVSRQQWIQVIDDLRVQCSNELKKLIKAHQKQANYYRSRIWQMENIILKRPIRPIDQKIIRSLSNKKDDLQSKLDLKQAQNIVLRQIKHYYQKRHENSRLDSQRTATQPDLKVNNNLTHSILANRHKRMKILHHQRSKADRADQSEIDDGDTTRNIKKMKHYITEKNRQHRFQISRMKQTSMSHFQSG